ncbi:hypothetical protein NKI26_32835, partial [Mesorhizobium australicum]
PMTTDTPLTRYSATNGALASRFVTAELHRLDLFPRDIRLGGERRTALICSSVNRFRLGMGLYAEVAKDDSRTWSIRMVVG